MFRKRILKRIKFIYNDENNYAFSTYVNSENPKKFDLYVYRHTVRSFLWIELNIYKKIFS